MCGWSSSQPAKRVDFSDVCEEKIIFHKMQPGSFIPIYLNMLPFFYANASFQLVPSSACFTHS